MRKTISLLLILSLVIFSVAGCSKDKNANKAETKEGVKISSGQVAKDTNTATDTKNVDDKSLLEIAFDSNEKLDLNNDIDIDKELGDIDSVLNDNDPLADIPNSLELN